MTSFNEKKTPPPNLTPLAERSRPKTLEEFAGQKHIVSDGKIIRKILDTGEAYSIVLWGEPGTGKTTLASLIASYCSMESHFLSAISAGVADVRKVIDRGKENMSVGKQTLLFLDEIHRFNKAQQDAVLGAVESGDIILIGATTENPSFSVISPLLSRTRVIRLEKLTEDDLLAVLDRVFKTDELFTERPPMERPVAKRLAELALGDARRMLNILETACAVAGKRQINLDDLAEAVKNSMLYYDKAGDKHYDTISAFIKSMRGSDPNAALYYMARMILSGEDPLFIARRMVIFASEDVGNASPVALNLAVSAYNAVKNIGMPEADIILGQCAAFLASAPKSNASYMGIKSAESAAAASSPEIPLHIRNAPTSLMKEMGYAKGYKYPHDFPGHFVKETYLPKEIADAVFYKPSEEGNEKAIAERLKRLWPEKYGK
ncbi:MAG: replication-associated recombination protein A [Leptospirales bacterium]|nr:replication-associated recombination protein A [Leptospirales bacterium]